MIMNLLMVSLFIFSLIAYAVNNPLGHGAKFRVRCFLNWLALGLTYGFMYMARYNLTVAKCALGNIMSKEDFGTIFAVGAVTYAVSLLKNGPLTDKIGGRKAMLIGATGSCLINIAMGIVTYRMLTSGLKMNLRLVFSLLCAANMYFQSYGAVAIIKVNAHWFHVKERGIFSGIFGTLIALGLYFAMDWNYTIVEATKAHPESLSFVQGLIRSTLGITNVTVDKTWYVFFIPAMILLVFIVIEELIVRDKPSQAGFEDFDTLDASSSEMHITVTTFELLKRMITNPIILTIAFIGLCSGATRDGIFHWYLIFSKEHIANNPAFASGIAGFFDKNWGALLCIAGASGSFMAGAISDKFFGSRRGPVAVLLYLGLLVGSLVMFVALYTQSYALLSLTVFVIALSVIGVQGVLAGTATMDFGGRRGAATATGIIDGFVYVGVAIQAYSLGFITTINWTIWPLFLMPFTILGLIMSMKIWHAFPKAKREAARNSPGELGHCEKLRYFLEPRHPSPRDGKLFSPAGQ